MQYHLIPVTQRTYHIVDEKGKVYNKKPKSKKKCHEQISAIESRKHEKKQTKGAGLTLSKMFQNAWVLPTRVEICEIDQVVPYKFQQIAHQFFHQVRVPHPMLQGARRIPNGQQVPNQVYLLNNTPQDRNILQLPYRILLRTTTGEVAAIAIEKEDTFNTLCAVLIQTTDNPQHPIVDRYAIEQHPV